MAKVLVLGDQGAGKSTVALVIARILMSKDKDIDLYTNMNITGDRINVISDWGELPLFDDRKKILIVDELMFSLDARESNSKHNRAVTRQIAFYRKANVILAIFMTHELGMVDVRLRDQLQYLVIGRLTQHDHFEYLLYKKTSRETTNIVLPKTKAVFDFADFDTRDFPNPLESEILQLDPTIVQQKSSKK